MLLFSHTKISLLQLLTPARTLATPCVIPLILLCHILSPLLPAVMVLSVCQWMIMMMQDSASLSRIFLQEGIALVIEDPVWLHLPVLMVSVFRLLHWQQYLCLIDGQIGSFKNVIFCMYLE